MTTIIAFVSQKGGVGKSTLSRALAREAAANGMKVKIADLDTQQATCVDWNRVRLEKNIEPVIAVEVFGTASQALKFLKGIAHPAQEPERYHHRAPDRRNLFTYVYRCSSIQGRPAGRQCRA